MSVSITALRRLRRPLAGLVGIITLAMFAAGCVTFSGTSATTQPGELGTTLHYSFAVCPNGASSSAGTTGGACANTNNSFGFPSAGRIVAGVLVPVGSAAPAVVTASLSTPVTVTRAGAPASRSDVQAFRTSSVSDDFNHASPPPAGSTWVAYISEAVSVPPGSTTTASVALDVALPIDANGNPPAGYARQVALQVPNTVPVTGTDPAAGQTDTLAWDCWVDADANGVPETNECVGTVEPASPAAGTLQRLSFTGPSAVAVQAAGAPVTSNLTLRLDGAALTTGTVSLTAGVSGSGVTVSAPTSAMTQLGADVLVPVTLTAARGAQPGTLTVTARTSTNVTRTAIVPVNVLAEFDSTRPSTTITARRLTNGTLESRGTATDQNDSAGLTGIKVQVIHGIRNGRCIAWTGTAFVREACARSLARWVTVPRTLVAGTTSFTWKSTTGRAVPGLWLLRARSADASGLVSRVGTARVTIPFGSPNAATL